MRTLLTAAVLAAALAATAAAQSKPVYKIGTEGVKSPVLTHEIKPIYTKGATDRKVQGSIELKAVVQADGTVAEGIRVTKSLDPDLDAAAITAVRQWTFRPGTKDDKPVDVEVDIELTFTLK